MTIIQAGKAAREAAKKLSLAMTYAEDGAMATAANLCREAAALLDDVAKAKQEFLEQLAARRPIVQPRKGGK